MTWLLILVMLMFDVSFMVSYNINQFVCWFLQRMFAVVYDSCGGPKVLKWKVVENPVLDFNEVLIKVEACGVNRRDLWIREGIYQHLGKNKYLGFECSGTIVKRGAAASKLPIGSKVCALLNGGGYAEYVAVPEDYVMSIPSGLTFEQAAAIPCSASLIWLSFFERNNLIRDDKVLIHGAAGGVGSLAVRIAKSLGCVVFATAGSEEKVDFCRTLDADFAINYKKQDFSEVVARETNGTGVNCVLDCLGDDVVDQNLKSLAVGGKLICIGYKDHWKWSSVEMKDLVSKDTTIMGININTFNVVEKRNMLEGIQRDIWPLLKGNPHLVDICATYSFAQATQAHTLMEKNLHRGKIVLLPRTDLPHTDLP
ncbi:uncharacterized protein [Coffea arabica]|uniref:Uncharacterized protein isoform X1 n=2 Tax=Coffea arabica TaxID=13443 RepID=A0ABM4VXQ2_COFAR